MPSASSLIWFYHRSIGFRRTIEQHWVFEKGPRHGGHWTRFFLQQELDQIAPESGTSLIEQIRIMQRAIDRMLSNAPVFIGDLRDR